MRATIAALLFLSACDYDWDSFQTVAAEQGLVVHLPLDDVSDGAMIVEHFEAETVPAGGCAVVPEYFNFCSDDLVFERTIDVPPVADQRYLFSARVYGVPAEGVAPEMNLVIDDAIEWTGAIEALADAPVVVQDEAVLEPGEHVFEIRFLNDVFMPENRDLRVDWLEVNAIGEAGRTLELVSRQRDAISLGAIETQGMRGGALRFDSVDDDVVLETPLSVDEAYTVALWLRPQDLVGTHAIVALHADSDVMLRTSGPHLQALGYAAASPDWPDYEVLAEDVLVIDEWTHVAFVVEGRRAAIFVGGVELASETYAGTVHAATPDDLIYVGQSGWHWMRDWFDGDLDDVRIYDRALTADEIAALIE